MSTAGASLPEQLAPRDRWVARVPVYYGWVMLPVAMIAQVATSPGQSFAIAVFNQSFTTAFDLSQKQLTGAFGIGTFLASFTLPLFGAMMDRWGIRRSMTLVVLLLGCACIYVSQVNGLLMLLSAFFLLRMFGQGALSLLANNTVAMWFRERLGSAAGMMSVGCILIMSQVPVGIRLLIDTVGWRWTYALLGIIVWAVMFPILILVYRNRPEDIGQLPDGGSRDTLHPTLAADEQTSFDLREAMRTRSYWIMFAAQATWAMIGTALVFNVQGLFTSYGLTAAAADRSLGLLFVSMAAMQLCGGFLADRIPLNRLAAASVAGLAAGLLIILLAGPAWLTIGYVVFGGSQGALAAGINTIWPRYYGRGHVGKIRGSVMSAAVAGSSLGPFIMGLSVDTFGHYGPSLWLFASIFAVLLVATVFATPPQKAGSLATA